jgi:hypothetical protein
MSSQGGAIVSAFGMAQMDIEELDGSRPPSAADGKRRKVGAQKRLHEDTRFGALPRPGLEPYRSRTVVSCACASSSHIWAAFGRSLRVI